MSGSTVVTFRATQAEDCIGRFAKWGGTVLADRGVLDDVRRYEVDAAQWRLYTRQTCSTPARQPRMKMYRCGEPGCKVTAVAGALGQHHKASGHEGREAL